MLRFESTQESMKKIPEARKFTPESMAQNGYLLHFTSFVFFPFNQFGEEQLKNKLTGI